MVLVRESEVLESNSDMLKLFVFFAVIVVVVESGEVFVRVRMALVNEEKVVGCVDKVFGVTCFEIELEFLLDGLD